MEEIASGFCIDSDEIDEITLPDLRLQRGMKWILFMSPENV